MLKSIRVCDICDNKYSAAKQVGIKTGQGEVHADLCPEHIHQLLQRYIETDDGELLREFLEEAKIKAEKEVAAV